jgi:hypothetical protein
MGRPRKTENEIMVNVSMKLTPEDAERLAQIAFDLERSLSFIARKFLLRGLNDYGRDGLLDDPCPGEVPQEQLTDILGQPIETPRFRRNK